MQAQSQAAQAQQHQQPQSQQQQQQQAQQQQPKLSSDAAQPAASAQAAASEPQANASDPSSLLRIADSAAKEEAKYSAALEAAEVRWPSFVAQCIACCARSVRVQSAVGSTAQQCV